MDYLVHFNYTNISSDDVIKYITAFIKVASFDYCIDLNHASGMYKGDLYGHLTDKNNLENVIKNGSSTSFGYHNGWCLLNADDDMIYYDLPSGVINALNEIQNARECVIYSDYHTIDNFPKLPNECFVFY